MLHKNSDTVFVKMKINKYRDPGTGECSHRESDLLSRLAACCPAAVAVSAAAVLAATAAVALGETPQVTVLLTSHDTLDHSVVMCVGLAHHLGFKLAHFLTKSIALPCR